MIKKVKYNVFDVFFGAGWTNWVRMELKEKNWEFVAGDRNYTKIANNMLSTRIMRKQPNGQEN